MPELAEVEYGRKVADKVAKGQKITEIRCSPDDIIFEDGAQETEQALLNASVVSTHRHGKYIWFELNRKPWPIFHFGMTGAFRAPDIAPIELDSKIREAPGEWPPRFTKIHMVFEDGRELVMTNARRLGRIKLRDDPKHEDPINQLGFDPYSELPTLDTFAGLLTKRTLKLKGLLLDQRFAAGIGNWLADEILFHARLDPRRSTAELDDQEIQKLHEAMQYVVHTAVSVDADKNRFPSSWLFHHRWGKKSEAEVEGGHLVEHITLGGRTTAWVPSLQR